MLYLVISIVQLITIFDDLDPFLAIAAVQRKPYMYFPVLVHYSVASTSIRTAVLPFQPLYNSGRRYKPTLFLRALADVRRPTDSWHTAEAT